MFAALSTLALIPLVLCVGVAVPVLGLHLELAHRREERSRHLLEEREAVIEEHESTIDAYRELVALQMSDLEKVSIPADF
jgi:hypothetical protein